MSKPDIQSVTGAARHARERDAIQDKAIDAYQTAVTRYAKLLAREDRKALNPAIIEEYRITAVCAFEAMLDATHTAAHALKLLGAARATAADKRRKRPEA